MNTAKKIIATIAGLMMMATMTPGIAQGVTIEELQAQIASLTALLSQLQTGATSTGNVPAACTGITFTRFLTVGSRGNDVICLQKILNQEVGSTMQGTGYFGSMTKAAVKLFQAKYGTGSLGTVGPYTRAKLNSIISGGGTTPGPVGGNNTVTLAANTPANSTIAKGAQDVVFAKINFCAAAAGNTISQIIFTRVGTAQDTDISDLKLYEGTTQIGSTQAINSTDHNATFGSMNWVIPVNSCKTLTLKSSMSANATVGDTPKFEISSASAISSSVALSGVFPISSSAMTIAGISVGALNVQAASSSATVIAGATEQAVAKFTLTASSTEALKITSVKVNEVGSSADADVFNIKLFYQSTQLGSTVASLANSAATFDLSAAPLELTAGTSKDLTVYVDVGAGTSIQTRKINFEITEKTDVTAYGSNSGGTVVAYGNTVNYNTTNDTWPQRVGNVDINMGSFTVTKDTTYSPSATQYARGTSQNDIIAFKFTAGANEAVRVTQVKLHSATGTALADSGVSNITLYDAATGLRLKDTNGNTIAAASMVSGYINFGSHTTGYDSTGLFDVEKSSYKTILVKADIPSGAATGTGLLGFEIDNPTTQIWADGKSSRNDLQQTDINAGVTTQVPSTELTHEILGLGTLTVSVSPNTAAAANYALGTQNVNFATFALTSTGEDVSVSQFNVYFATNTTATTAADSADINNVKLYDGDTLLQTDTTVSSGYAEFSLNITVPKNTTKNLKVVADVPIGSDASQLIAYVQKKSDVTAKGGSSSTTIIPTASNWASVKGNTMTKGTATLTVKAATTPSTQTYIKNAAGVEVLQLLLTASPTEDITVTRIRIAADSTSTATSTAGTATSTFSDPYTSGGLLPDTIASYVSNAKLYDGSAQVGVTVPTFTAGDKFYYADFTGLGLVVPKGTTKVISVKVDVNKSTTTSGNANAFYFGVATTTVTAVDIAGSGVQSGNAATIAIETGGVGGQPMFLGAAGTLVVALAADTPISAMTPYNNTMLMGKWRFTAVNEDIKISKLVFDAHHGSATSATISIAAARIYQLATSGIAGRQWAINYSIAGAATQTCLFNFSYPAAASPTDRFISSFNSATTTCYASGTADGLVAYSATTTAGAVTLYASATTPYSIDIRDYPNPYLGGGDASNAADTLFAGLRYGLTENVVTRTGADQNVVSGKVGLWNGSTKVAETALSGGQAVYNFSSGNELNVSKTSGLTLTLSADISGYPNALSGSTLSFSIGSTTATDIDYITAQGGSSASDIGVGSITMDAEKAGNTMWIYTTYPKVSLNSGSPSGNGVVGTSKEVFRFDVENKGVYDLDINAIRFTLSGNASSAMTDKAFNLYKTTDLSTVIGTSISWASATSSATTAYVGIYPVSGTTVPGGTTVTYALYANTSSMNESSSKNETLTVSIENGDFYWNDSSNLTASYNANQKVLGIPVTGNTLTY